MIAPKTGEVSKQSAAGAWLPNGQQIILKGWLAIAKLKSLSLFISLLLVLKKAFDNVKIEK